MRDSPLSKCGDPEPEDPESGGGLPFILDPPNFELMRSFLNVPSTVTAQIAAFAHEPRCYRNDADFLDSQTERLKFAPESFIAPGLFTSAQDESPQPEATAMVAGHVVAAKIITNPVTQAQFHAVQVRTLRGMMDVVADPAIVVGELVTDGVVRGTFWLSGRLLDVQGAEMHAQATG